MPARAVPQAQQRPRGDQVEPVARVSHAAPAQRAENVVLEPVAHRDVPGASVQERVPTEQRVVEVARELDPEERAEPLGHRRVAREVAVDLDQEERRPQADRARPESLGRFEHAIDYHRHVVRHDYFLEQAQEEQLDAPEDLLLPHRIDALELREELLRPEDRPRDEVRKEGHVERVLEEVVAGRDLPPIDVDHVGHRLERVERDPERDDELQVEGGRVDPRNEGDVVQEEVSVLEVNENPEVRREGEREVRLARGPSLRSRDARAHEVVEARGEPQEEQERGVPRPVEEPAREQQQELPPPSLEHEGEHEDEGEEERELEAVESQAASRFAGLQKIVELVGDRVGECPPAHLVQMRLVPELLEREIGQVRGGHKSEALLAREPAEVLAEPRVAFLADVEPRERVNRRLHDDELRAAGAQAACQKRDGPCIRIRVVDRILSRRPGKQRPLLPRRADPRLERLNPEVRPSVQPQADRRHALERVLVAKEHVRLSREPLEVKGEVGEDLRWHKEIGNNPRVVGVGLVVEAFIAEGVRAHHEDHGGGIKREDRSCEKAERHGGRSADRDHAG